MRREIDVKAWQAEEKDRREGWKRDRAGVRRYLAEHPDVLSRAAFVAGIPDRQKRYAALLTIASEHRLDYHKLALAAEAELTRRRIEADADLKARLSELYRECDLPAFRALCADRGLYWSDAMELIHRERHAAATTD